MWSISQFHEITVTWKESVPWETNLHENSFCVWTAVNTEAQISFSRPSSSSPALLKFPPESRQTGGLFFFDQSVD